MSISLYDVLGVGHGQFVILEEVSCNLGFWKEFLISISLYEVLRAGCRQFGILEGVSFAYLTICSPWSGPHAI